MDTVDNLEFIQYFKNGGNAASNDDIDYGDFCLAASKYSSDSDFSSDLDAHMGISILSSNICSLNSKFDELSLYLINLKQSVSGFNNNSSSPEIICLQECHINENSDLCLYQLPDYVMVGRINSASSKGGLVTYLHKSLKFEELNIQYDKGIWEGQFFKITNGNKQVIIGNVYRPPRTCVASLYAFFDGFKCSIEQLGRRNSELVVVGDFNIDLLKIYENPLHNTVKPRYNEPLV